MTPFEKQEAFKYGIIDKDGKVLRKFRTLKTTAEKKSYTILHRFVFNLKRILKRIRTWWKTRYIFVDIGLLIREDKSYLTYKNLIESAIITYLKETNQYELIY